MTFLYRFSIDVFSPSVISGWCYHRLLKVREVTLVFSSGSRVLGECVANLFREDLLAQHLHPNGRCGFSFAIPETLHSAQSEDITISIKESGTRLIVVKRTLMGRVVPRQTPLAAQAVRWLRRQMNRRQKVFFMHIPKTAGTSFNSLAGTLYRSGDILTHIESYSRDDFPEIAAKYTFISGHLRIGEVKTFFPSDHFQLYALIREPYAHLHSHFNWLRSIGADKNSAFYKTHHHLFKDIADQFGTRSSLCLDDLQTIVDNLTGVLREIVDNSQTRHFLDNSPEEISASDCSEAIKNLNLFKRVGLTERYSHFENSFCLDNGFHCKPNSTPLNRSKFSQLYDHKNPATREILLPLVHTDLQLYNYVQKRCQNDD